ncbi:MAG: S8 family serine peptidase [Streptosporangiaceae bacterium]
MPARTYTLAPQMHGKHASTASYPPDLRLIDDEAAQANGDRGQGTSVAVLDDGTNYHDSAFGKCAKLGSAGCRVLAYRDFAAAPGKGLSFTGHGTNVAAQVLKVAPEARLVVGNVFHRTKSGGAAYSDATVIKGLQWVLSEASTVKNSDPIRAVNLSLGVWSTYYAKSCTSSPYAAVFSQLAGANVQPVLAAGNSAYENGKFRNGVTTPACTPHALDVGAVYDQNIGKQTWEKGESGACTDKTTAPGEMACFSQRGPLLGVVAPGVGERAAGITDTGTSQAAPLVSGAIAALASGARTVRSDQIAAAIKATGKAVADPHAGGTVPRLDVRAAQLSLNASGSWQDAIEVPGIAALNTGLSAYLSSMSCPSAGNCGAVGDYRNDFGQDEAFVVSEVNGTWGTAIEVPGTAALSSLGYDEINSVSCASAGNCTAAGNYTGTNGRLDVFVISQRNGAWGTAIDLTGLSALNQSGPGAAVNSVSCASAGNCSAGGHYTDASQHQQAFVVSQVNGTWGTPVEVPGTPALNAGGNADINSVSCAPAGNCSAGGYYTDASNHEQAFVVSQVNGTWRTAAEVRGAAALNTSGKAAVTSLSCRSAGNCSAAGDHDNDAGAFVVSQVNGTWGKAIKVPGTAGGPTEVESVSCASPGNCSAGGGHTDASGHEDAFVVSQVNGTWHTAIKVPGAGALSAGGATYITSVSCAPAGTCSAGGLYSAPSGQQAMVASQG